MVTRGAKASPHKMSPAVRLQPNQARTPSARTPSARTPSACHFLSLSLSLAAAAEGTTNTRRHLRTNTRRHLGTNTRRQLRTTHHKSPSQVTSCAPPTYELRDETASHRHTHTLATSCVKAP
jgi:hypothetical protein